MSTAISEQNLEKSVDYVRDFFLYADRSNKAMEELFRIAAYRTAQALERGWKMPARDVRLASNLEYLRDTFPPQDATAESLVESEIRLISFPDIYFRIKEVLDRPGSSADDVARVVQGDVELTARLLRLVNSPLFGLVGKVEDVGHAIALAGLEEVSNLALGLFAVNVFKDIPQELMDMPTFWKHSFACGVFAKLISTRMPGAKVERFFTAGLLHDVGRLVIFKKLPYATVQVLLHARSNTLPIVEAERDLLGFDHTEVARLLLDRWNFPKGLIDLIANHHNPSEAGDPVGGGVLQLADNMTNAMEIASGGMYVLPGLEDGAWDRLSLKPSALVDITVLFDDHIDGLFSTLLS